MSGTAHSDQPAPRAFVPVGASLGRMAELFGALHRVCCSYEEKTKLHDRLFCYTERTLTGALATAASSLGWPAAEEYQDWKAGRSGQARTDLWVEVPRARDGWAIELKYDASYNIAGSDPKLQTGGRLLHQWSLAVADAFAIRKKYPPDATASYSDVWAGVFLALATRSGKVTDGRGRVGWVERPGTASWGVPDWKTWAAREARVLRHVVTDRQVLKKLEVPGWRGVPLLSPEFVGFSLSPRFNAPVRETADGAARATGRTWIGFFFAATRV